MEADLEIEFETPKMDVLLSTPKIFIDDGFRNIAQNKGHGLQRVRHFFYPSPLFRIIHCTG